MIAHPSDPESWPSSIGGATFSVAEASFGVRSRPLPRQPVTIRKSAREERLIFLMQVWSQMSAANKSTWSDWAAAHPYEDRFGNPVVRPGYCSFIKVNSPRVYAQMSVLEPAPAAETLVGASDIVIVRAVSSPTQTGLLVRVNVGADWFLGIDQRLIVAVAPSQFGIAYGPAGEYRYAGYRLGSDEGLPWERSFLSPWPRAPVGSVVPVKVMGISEFDAPSPWLHLRSPPVVPT